MLYWFVLNHQRKNAQLPGTTKKHNEFRALNSFLKFVEYSGLKSNTHITYNGLIQKDKNIIGRSRHIHEGQRGSGPVVYWMERDLRFTDNWALLYAQQEALIRQKPLHVLIVIEADQLTNPTLQTLFKIQGIAELLAQSRILNIQLNIISGDLSTSVIAHSLAVESHLLVTDFSPLHSKKKALSKIEQEIKCPLVEVDTHNIIPAWIASPKKEYGAYTIRPKIHRLLPDYLTDIPALKPHPHVSSNCEEVIQRHAFDELSESLSQYSRDECGTFLPGPSAAEQQMKTFIRDRLAGYDTHRNNPNEDGQSGLSPYLHFGQLSPQRLAFSVLNADVNQSAKDSFLEELIVRRELADNFCFYEENYDSFAGFHPWAQQTLNEHRDDTRDYCYTLKQLEDAETHEDLWNSCQRDLATNHKLHGFLRMYWAKKILEWTSSPEEALHAANYLNDKYSIDGSDPNGYNGTAWSIGGIHDRAWAERKVFGKIRYMNERGCRRKFNVDQYIAKHST